MLYVSILQERHYGELFVLSWAKVQQVCLGSVSSVLFIFGVCSIFNVLSFCEVFCDYGGVYCCEVCVYVMFCNGVGVCANVCCVSNVVEWFVFGVCECVYVL